MPRRLTLRSRSDLHIEGDLDPKEEEVEYAAGCINVFVQIIYLLGSVFYLNEVPGKLHIWGIWLFIIGGFISMLISLHNARTSFTQKKRTMYVKMESYQSVFFTLAGCGFFVGSILWLPPLYHEDHFMGHAWGAWLFIVGSSCMVAGTFVNVLMVEREAASIYPQVPSYIKRMATISLACATTSSCIFVAASFLFRPGIENECSLFGNNVDWRQEGNLDWPPPSAMSQNITASPGETNEDVLLKFLKETNDIAEAVQPALRKSASKEHAALAPDIPATSLASDEDDSAIDNSVIVASISSKTGKLVVGHPKDSAVIERCVSVVETGAWLFIVGSVCSLAQSLLAILCTYCMSKQGIMNIYHPPTTDPESSAQPDRSARRLTVDKRSTSCPAAADAEA